MLTRDTIIEMVNLFFNGKPEEAYKLVKDMNECEQFINSIKKYENQLKAYEIMENSDLNIWEKHTSFVKKEIYPRYDIGL